MGVKNGRSGFVWRKSDLVRAGCAKYRQTGGTYQRGCLSAVVYYRMWEGIPQGYSRCSRKNLSIAPNGMMSFRS